MTTLTKPLIDKIAAAFCRKLRAMLTPEELAEAVALNRAEKTDNVCHSHDFCDANVAMIDALEELGVELDLQDDVVCGHINGAWELAKRADFALDTIHEFNTGARYTDEGQVIRWAVSPTNDGTTWFFDCSRGIYGSVPRVCCSDDELLSMYRNGDYVVSPYAAFTLLKR